MERHEMEIFLTLAEELHFGRTAERLGISQGRVSQTIKRLERRFGVLLFERTSRRVTLTPAGRRFRDDLLPAHRQIQQAIARVIAAGRGITGTLRVGYSSQMAGDVVLRAAEKFQAGHPDCQVEIREVQLGDPYGRLRAGDLDLQLTEFPVDEPDITVGPVVLSEPRALLVPVGHPLAGRESVSLEDYADTTLIAVTGAVPQLWLDHHYPRTTPSGRSVPHGPTAPHFQEVLALVAAGRGVSPVSLVAAAYYSRPGIVYVPFHDAPPIEYGLMWPATGETARVRAFVQAVRDAAGRGAE
ncbi:LysR family transcriptional regulator [Actinoallomurus purpureus]|uniref:LysR family transcriptional regulator n=1 Tax=Actinoallomurus purpureus TaxID=478114 RepID=UPI002093A2E3|nr:LysR family transcriptional regulator [Actinoallomurus purpureus]MCO6006028.1 LysR family transcriptional regulator [Actinoallomurus purpureus]